MVLIGEVATKLLPQVSSHPILPKIKEDPTHHVALPPRYPLPSFSCRFLCSAAPICYIPPAKESALDHLPPLTNKSNRTNNRHPVFDPHFVYRCRNVATANSFGGALHRFLFSGKWARKIQHGHFDPRRGRTVLSLVPPKQNENIKDKFRFHLIDSVYLTCTGPPY